MPLQVYDVLLELNAAAGRCLRMKELAARTVLTRSRVSRLVDELERAGLAGRRADPADGRGAVVAITSAGRRALQKGAPIHLADIAHHFTVHLSDEEGAMMTTALERVLRAHEPLISRRSSR
ncbi:MAG: MarR family winged helix-turn-helix transcriptional regulator [Acidimicrobiales bacterium]